MEKQRATGKIAEYPKRRKYRKRKRPFRCPDCSRTDPHVHCPECGSTDHAAANCDAEDYIDPRLT